MFRSVRMRHVRGLALASASFGLGLAGHLEGGGGLGAPGSLMFGAAFCALSGWASSWRQLSTAGVATVLLVNQAVMHVALALEHQPATGPPPAGPATTGPSTAGPATAGPATDAVTDCALSHGTSHGTPMTMSLVPDRQMVLAHLVASLLAAAVIVTAEALWLALGALACWLSRVVRVVLRTPVLPPRPRAAVLAALPHRTTRDIGARPGRGPPHPSPSW